MDTVRGPPCRSYSVEELGGELEPPASDTVGPTAAGPAGPAAAAAAGGHLHAHNPRHAHDQAATTTATASATGAASKVAAIPATAAWWPPDLVLRLRELQLPATPALLALLHLPRPALSLLEVLDLQVIMAQGFGGPLGPGDQALAGTARLVAALRVSGAGRG